MMQREAGAIRMLPATPPRRPSRRNRRWGVILAGGDGLRLRPLTKLICGDDRPKQFCPLLGDSTLFGAGEAAGSANHPLRADAFCRHPGT